jgi:hypothetical protein
MNDSAAHGYAFQTRRPGGGKHVELAGSVGEQIDAVSLKSAPETEMAAPILGAVDVKVI